MAASSMVFLDWVVAYYMLCLLRGAAVMMKNLVAACVLAALIIMGLLAFAQHHEECWHGHSIKTFKPCGSLSSSI